jgi:arsenate reductase
LARAIEEKKSAETQSTSERFAMPSILFICTGNACRSPMAEGLARHYGMGRVEVFSAGVRPFPLNARAVRVMAEKDIDISRHIPKGLEAVEINDMSLVVTLCDYAQTLCPAGPLSQHRLHWSIKDPTSAQGPEWFVLRSYRAVRDELDERVCALIMGIFETIGKK